MSKTVRCKFRCIETGQASSSGDQVLHSAKFQAVYGDCPENKEFFKWTPHGELVLGVVAAQHFEAGKEYFLDITLAE